MYVGMLEEGVEGGGERRREASVDECKDKRGKNRRKKK
jgi:hypothetical protein